MCEHAGHENHTYYNPGGYPGPEGYPGHQWDQEEGTVVSSWPQAKWDEAWANQREKEWEVVAGSWALHEHLTRCGRRPEWTPGDVDVWVTQHQRYAYRVASNFDYLARKWIGVRLHRSRPDILDGPEAGDLYGHELRQGHAQIAKEVVAVLRDQPGGRPPLRLEHLRHRGAHSTQRWRERHRPQSTSDLHF